MLRKSAISARLVIGCGILGATSCVSAFRLNPTTSPARCFASTTSSTTSIPAASSGSASSPSHAVGVGGGGIPIQDLRKEYSAKGLLECDLLPSGCLNDPYKLFDIWFNEACSANVLEPNAMCLSTCVDNKPAGRFVLLKAHDERGFVWYTNFQSRKGEHLSSNPQAALTFWWGDLERSVRIEGLVETVSDAEADAYFSSRPRSSQIGAWTSNQSRPIADRASLEKQEEEIKRRFESGESIPRPPHWGGYRLVPHRIEFWKGRSSRLHDRIVFERDEEAAKKRITGDTWRVSRLQP